jgi:VanZ family protein
VAAYVAVAYALSLDPGTPRPGVPGVDKLLHVVEYGILGVLLARSVGGAPRFRQRVALVAVGLALGIGDELIQSTVPGRTAGIPDALADVAGATIGVAIAPRVFRRRGAALFV